MPTALVIDGAFFLRRIKWSFPHLDHSHPASVAEAVRLMGFWHLAMRLTPLVMDRDIKDKGFQPAESAELYRIFFYDCPPLTKRLHTPVSKRSINLAKTPVALHRLAAHRELRKVRKVALRLGRLNDETTWRLRPEAYHSLTNEDAPFRPTDEDFEIDTKQKGVDMRLGIDVAAMAFKRQVNQIILVAADADFVPAVKLARREGIDVVLDPMGAAAAADLLEHVDGVRSCRMYRPPLRDL